MHIEKRKNFSTNPYFPSGWYFLFLKDPNHLYPAEYGEVIIDGADTIWPLTNVDNRMSINFVRITPSGQVTQHEIPGLRYPVRLTPRSWAQELWVEGQMRPDHTDSETIKYSTLGITEGEEKDVVDPGVELSSPQR
jgi:hypothetical protein